MAPIPPPASKTVEAIYAAYAATPREPERGYLGMSSIGEECDRRLWYGFRFAHAEEVFEGRKIRLFDTGTREEARLISDLRTIGCEVWEVDPGTGAQWAVSAAHGHARGHLDAVVRGIPDAPQTPHVFEAKTHSTKSFKAVSKDGVAKSKPTHYAQMQGYMHLLSLTRALYLAVCKETDEIYAERVEYDAAFSMRLIARAERIAFSDRAPAKLHEDPSSKLAWACSYCPALAVCHQGQFARRNCRTCLHSQPTMGGDGEWRCARSGAVLSLDDQRAGCGSHLYLPDLVPGAQEDADPERETVTYRLATGDLWVDGQREAA